MINDDEDFKAKLMAVVLDYSFNDYNEDKGLGKFVYRAINSAFTEYQEQKKIQKSVWLFGAGSGFEQPKEETKKERKQSKSTKKIRETLKSQVQRKINDIKDLIEKNRIIKRDGTKGKKIDWDAVADEAYNLFDVKRSDGTKPTGRNIADAFNHLKDPENKVMIDL